MVQTSLTCDIEVAIFSLEANLQVELNLVELLHILTAHGKVKFFERRIGFKELRVHLILG